MTIDRLREALSAIGPPPDARELSEILWLACHISPPEAARPAPPVVAAAPEEPAELPRPAAPSVPDPRPPAREPLSRLHPRPAPGAAGPVGEASEVLVPTAPMLADPLGVQRALRPLKRRVPSRHRFELDEDATAARIAETRLWTPVLVPSPERWLSLSLVVDTGPTMRLWRPLARELTETLLRQGAFQDVHLGYLDTTGGITATPDAPRQAPGTLLDASGRHAVLVLSDCSGPHWWNGRAAQAVRRWAQTGPTAILQPLAERLWRRTAAPATPGIASLPRPAAPNTDLRFTPYDGAAAPGIPVPVLEASPRWFGAWARLVSGSDPQPAAIATIPSRPAGTAPVRRERELAIGERVRRFLATASPDAAELAAHVAVSVPSLPVMRLIQHRVLGGSGPGQLAEVLLSGLLRPAGGVRYEFVPGAREALLDTLPRPEALHTRRVLEAVSAEIERRAGTSADQFRALLPTEGGPVTLTADTDHFALLTPQTRAQLVPEPPHSDAPDLLELIGIPVDELLGDEWDHRPPSPIPIGVDGNGDTVSIDLLSGARLPRGTILGPPAATHRMLRTILLSLALNHSPERVAFALVNCSDFYESDSSLGLNLLPHIAATVHNWQDLDVDAVTSMLRHESQRREKLLREADVQSWDEYQAAIARGRRLGPLPALVVVLGLNRPLPGAERDLTDYIARASARRQDLGFRYVFYPAEAGGFDFLPRWRIAFTDDDATLQDERPEPTRFRPAQIPSTVIGPLLTSMDRRGPRARGLTVHPPASALDVLGLNGALDGGFEEGWGLPAFTPRNPAIGHDADGNVVTLYPLDLSSGLPHGLVVGETEARQRAVRATTLALAASYSPRDFTLIFAGLGEHPLGEELDLPHVRFSEDELLGQPERLSQFIDFLSAELDFRARASSADVLSRLLVVADLSLTFPSSRREVGETLLSLAQRGRALGVQLLLSSASVENTTTWSRFLPLLGWRIAASRLPPAELQRVLGRANLPFADDQTAYLLAGGGTPRPFTVAPEPPEAALDDFLERARSRSEPALPTDRSDEFAELRRRLSSMMAEARDANEGLPARPGGEHEVIATFRELMEEEIESRRMGRRPGPHHLVFEGSHSMGAMAASAWLYAALLGELGVVSRGRPRSATSEDSHGLDLMNTTGAVLDTFESATGSVLYFHVTEYRSPREGPDRSTIGTALNTAMTEFGDDPVVILYGESPVLERLWERTPGLRDRFRRTITFADDEARPEPDAAPSATVAGTRVPIGVDADTDEPVLLDFTADRHLLIAGPSGSGKGALMSYLLTQLTTGAPTAERIVNAFDSDEFFWTDGGGTSSAGSEQVSSAEQLRRRIRAAIARVEQRQLTGQGPDNYLFVRNRRRLLEDDPYLPLAPLLQWSLVNGLHLVLARHQISFGEPADPLVEEMRSAGGSLLLTGYAGGQEADLWDVPSTLRGPIRRGQALLAQPGRHRIVQLPELS
ncbi:hypothetical protein E1287_18525 [Actinomadura sp. KC06]|uniref:SAV_2336 N-terminal domain-related protein n=1 Tax=Actinomadura sp. KC06 TaxID=2530369 RepID=UPI001053F3D5|nr:SAV_2336 N-terminal domain-related protein [Actinomadura sp. KC06]TDD33829.1 hypothetical protein E1287_18525 [Actinomadura sp. KC06]